jgi:hypothetical protein
MAASAPKVTLEQIMALLAKTAANMDALTEKVSMLADTVSELAEQRAAAPAAPAAAPRAAKAASSGDDEPKARAVNPWTEFQRVHKGQMTGWSMEDKKAAYGEWKAIHFPPPPPPKALTPPSARKQASSASSAAGGGGGGAQPPKAVQAAFAAAAKNLPAGDLDYDE